MNKNEQLQDMFLVQFFAAPFAEVFYLTGGTALARFYYHHRESIDLDLFTQDQEIDFAAVNRSVLGIIQSMQLVIVNQVITNTFMQFILQAADGTPLKVDFVRDIPVHFGKIIVRNTVRLDSIENIGSNKLLAIFGRTDAKDFIDLYWILQKSCFSFDHFYQQALEKDTGLSEFYLAYALQSIRQIQHFPVMRAELPWEEIKLFYQNLAIDLLRRIKPE